VAPKPRPEPGLAPRHDRRTVDEARVFLNSRFAKGTRCPCCEQRVQLYARKLPAVAARFVVWLNGRHARGIEWADVKDCPVRGGDYAKVKHWGLVEQKPNDDPKKKSSGLWRLTARGTAFASNTLAVPTHHLVYNDTSYGTRETTITIEEALNGGGFDYEELMRHA